MADFISDFWSWYIIIPTALSFVGLFWLLQWMTHGVPRPKDADKTEDTGHVWDDDLREYNNPLPAWWLNMFYLTMVFGIIYLLLYPGMGTFEGLSKWTQTGQYQQEMDSAKTAFGELYAKYQNSLIPDLVEDPTAIKIGQRLYLNYCTACHGSDARGTTGFPNLRDSDWLYGGQPEQIEASILNGRMGVMPGWLTAMGNDGVRDVTEYVMSLSGRRVDAEAAGRGKEKFATCAACHGADGKGNIALGAPNLTDSIWLYGSSVDAIRKTIAEGRNGNMPAHKDFLGADKAHLVAAYVYALSNEKVQGKEGK